LPKIRILPKSNALLLSTLERILGTVGMVGAIRLAKLSKRDSLSRFEREKIWVSFLVNSVSTREYQRRKIVEEIEELKRRSPLTRKPILAVFSMNVECAGTSFEMGFWIE
jgi:hypothetical protein